MEKAQAERVYKSLRHVSADILTAHGCWAEPHRPVTRTRRFREGQPRGIIFHYTGGSTIRGPMKWGNRPQWGNTGSSWHVLIGDRVPGNRLGHMWDQAMLERPELAALFPVPVIVMADFRYGTWHANWINDLCLGIENRNSGHAGKASRNNGAVMVAEKPAVEGGDGKVWESYPREQLIANVNVGRLVHAMFGLNPMLCLPHQAVWATKVDTGPLFPMKAVREAIFSGEPVEELSWLDLHPLTPSPFCSAEGVEGQDVRWYQVGNDGFRGDPHEWVPIQGAEATQGGDRHECVLDMLECLGFDARPETWGRPPLQEGEFEELVRWFQRSTVAYRQTGRGGGKGRQLKIDGICGPKTSKALRRRARQVTISVD